MPVRRSTAKRSTGRRQDSRNKNDSRDNKRGSRASHGRRRSSLPEAHRHRPPAAIIRKQTAPAAMKTRHKGSTATSSHKADDEHSTAEAPVVHMVQMLLKKGVKMIEKEYESLALYHPSPRHNRACKANEDRNRYNDVDLCDDTRVILRDYGVTDYIHANWVDCGAVKTICMQGPLDNTQNDFWHMVWQENISLVIMLCETVERDREKCSEYWPTGRDTIHYGQYSVTKTSEKQHYLAGGYELRESLLELALAGFAPRTVCHSQLKDWPDRGVLHDPRALLKLRKYLENNAAGKPVAVHCSAGVGRTGTLVLLEMCLNELDQKREVDLPSCFRRLRQQRYHSIQNVAQYRFVCHALLEYAEAKHRYFGDYKRNIQLRQAFKDLNPKSE